MDDMQTEEGLFAYGGVWYAVEIKQKFLEKGISRFFTIEENFAVSSKS